MMNFTLKFKAFLVSKALCFLRIKSLNFYLLNKIHQRQKVSGFAPLFSREFAFTILTFLQNSAFLNL